MKKWILGIFMIALTAGMVVGQETISYWNFNEATGTAPLSWPSPVAASTGSGTMTHDFASDGTNGVANFTGSTLNIEGADAAGGSFSPQGGTGLINNNKSLVLSISTTGYGDLILSYAGRGTSTGFSDNIIDYSVDGENFINFTTLTGRNVTSFSTLTVDLSSITEANNNPNFKIKITFNGASTATGNNRVDNIKLVGSSLTIEDGAGSATVVNNSEDAFTGTDILASGTVSLQFEFNGTSAGDLESVSIEIPSANFGTLNIGNVFISGDAFADAEVTLDGSIITITGAVLNNVSTGGLLVNNLSAFQSPSTLGISTFTVKTAKSGGTLTEIANSPKTYTIVPIGWVTMRDEGVLTHAGKTVAVSGVATVANGSLSTTNLEVYMQEADDYGINVFKIGAPPTFTVGTRYAVKGQLTNFNGLTEIIPSTNADIIDLGAATPIKYQNNISGETFFYAVSGFQGRYLAIQYVTKVAGTWPTIGQDATLTFEDQFNYSFTVYIDAQGDIDGSTEPTWPKDIKGILTVKNNNAGLMMISLEDIAEEGALPVELSSFTVAKIGNDVVLNWSTTTETNNYGFEVEAQKGSSWSKIGFVAGKGTTTEAQSYSFVDNSVTPGIISYRLKQIDFDGKYEYSTIQTLEIMPETFELLGNYPNPFNPTTMINFQTAYTGHVTVTVFDVLGRQIKVLVNEERPAGIHQVPFNATGISSGLYFYQVKAGNEVRTGRMLLSK